MTTQVSKCIHKVIWFTTDNGYKHSHTFRFSSISRATKDDNITEVHSITILQINLCEILLTLLD